MLPFSQLNDIKKIQLGMGTLLCVTFLRGSLQSPTSLSPQIVGRGELAAKLELE